MDQKFNRWLVSLKNSKRRKRPKKTLELTRDQKRAERMPMLQTNSKTSCMLARYLYKTLFKILEWIKNAWILPKEEIKLYLKWKWIKKELIRVSPWWWQPWVSRGIELCECGNRVRKLCECVNRVRMKFYLFNIYIIL